jgi:hypothetical protein
VPETPVPEGGVITHEELLELLEAEASIVTFESDPPGAYSAALIDGELYEPVTSPSYPHDWPDWRHVPTGPPDREPPETGADLNAETPGQ